MSEEDDFPKNTRNWAIQLLRGEGEQIRDKLDGSGGTIRAIPRGVDWREFHISGAVGNKTHAITRLLAEANITSDQYGFVNCTPESCDFQISRNALEAVRALHNQTTKQQGFGRQ